MQPPAEVADKDALDAALIGAARVAEHDRITRYGSRIAGYGSLGATPAHPSCRRRSMRKDRRQGPDLAGRRQGRSARRKPGFSTIEAKRRARHARADPPLGVDSPVLVVNPHLRRSDRFHFSLCSSSAQRCGRGYAKYTNGNAVTGPGGL